MAVIDEDAGARFHPGFTGRVLAPRIMPGDDRARDAGAGSHGINVAGLVLASGPNGRGVAPKALLLPLAVPQLGVSVGTHAEARALRSAADNGADIICCAWA